MTMKHFRRLEKRPAGSLCGRLLKSALLFGLFLQPLLASGCAVSPAKESPVAPETEEAVQKDERLIEGASPKDEEVLQEKAEESNQTPAAPERKDESAEEKASETASKEVVVHVLDVGQGLSLVVESDGQVLMYDGGDREKSSYVVSWLKKNDIREINDMIASHYDADHINGLVGALNTVKVDRIYAPDYSCTTRVCNSFDTLVEEKNLPLTHPYAGDSFKLGSAEVTFVAPEDHTYEDENNYSGAIRIVNGKTSCLISGDAMEISEQEMVSRFGSKLKSDVYVAGHHGSNSSSSTAFLDAVDPSSVIISCGKNNSYGHPDERVLEEFKKRNMDVYRTDEQGEITFVMTQDAITFKQKTAPDPFRPGSREENYEHHEDKSAAGTDSAVPDNAGSPLMQEDQAQDYVLNTRSKKIHLPDCPSVSKMSKKNREDVHSTLSGLKAQGYEPCKNCLAGC